MLNRRFLFPVLILAGCGLAAAAQAKLRPNVQPKQSFACQIEPRQTVNVRSSVDGVIDRLYVHRGDDVKRGELLATLESGPQRAALAVARARAEMQGDVDAAQAKVDLTKKKWQRAEELRKKNFVSKNKSDEAQEEYKLAIEQLREAHEKQHLAALEVRSAEQELDERSIRSPVNGIVAKIMLRPGDLLSSNQKDPVMRLVQVDPLNVELVLPFSRFGQIKPGERAEVFPQAPVGGKYLARVEVVDPVVDAASDTFGVRLRLPNPHDRVPAGIECRVRF